MSFLCYNFVMNISKRSLYVLSFIAVSLLLLAGIYFYLIKTDYSNTRDASLYQISKNNLDLSAPVHVEGDVEYVMNPTKYDELKFPKIVNYPDKNIMDKVNNSLKDELDNISCDENESRPDIKPYILSTWGDFNISVDYAKNYIFSIHQEGEDDCGAYPSMFSYSTVFDMKTGEDVPFEKLFKNYKRDKDKILSLVYEKDIAKTDEENRQLDLTGRIISGCDGVNSLETIADNLQDYEISTTTKSIIVHPFYPHAYYVCSPYEEISIDKLLPFIDKDSILNRLYEAGQKR